MQAKREAQQTGSGHKKIGDLDPAPVTEAEFTDEPVLPHVARAKAALHKGHHHKERGGQTTGQSADGYAG